MTAAITEASAAHASALAEWQQSLIQRRQARAALAESEKNVELAAQKLNHAASAFARLVGDTGENE